jgi:transposase
VGLEACPLSQWLYDGLAAAGLPAICIEVRHLKAALSAMTNKTDRNDARGIAQVMRTGWFRAVHVKSTRSHELKMLLTSRKLLVNKLLDVENQIRGSLKVFGFKVGKISRRQFEARVLELLDFIPPAVPAFASRSKNPRQPGCSPGSPLRVRRAVPALPYPEIPLDLRHTRSGTCASTIG